MKNIFYLILILFLTLSVRADDLSEFEIEGISIGDSVFDHYSNDDLTNFSKQFYPSSDDFQGVEILKKKSKKNFLTYDSITLNWKKNDNKMKIVAVSGIKLIPNDLNKCLKERDQIATDIKNILNNAKEESYEMSFGELNDSISYAIDLKIKSGSIRIWCTDWDSKTEKENNWQDDLNVSLDTDEFIFWLDNIAYK